MASPRRKKRFLLCVRNARCEDLELRKLYEHLPDAVAAREGYVRVVDESGEDYLYPETYFVAVPGQNGFDSKSHCGECVQITGQNGTTMDVVFDRPLILDAALLPTAGGPGVDPQPRYAPAPWS